MSKTLYMLIKNFRNGDAVPCCYVTSSLANLPNCIVPQIPAKRKVEAG
jgi:hypothetical protein